MSSVNHGSPFGAMVIPAGSLRRAYPVPDRIVDLDVSGLGSGVAAVSLAESYPCAPTNGGGVACWDSSNIPLGVPGVASGVREISVGGQHACALVTVEDVMCWGSNENAQLGGVMRCSTTSVALDVPFDGGALTPPPSEPVGPGRIEHVRSSWVSLGRREPALPSGSGRSNRSEFF